MRAEGTGLEHTLNPQGKEQVSGHPTHNPTHSGSLPKNLASVDPLLQAIIDRWDPSKTSSIDASGNPFAFDNDLPDQLLELIRGFVALDKEGRRELLRAIVGKSGWELHK